MQIRSPKNQVIQDAERQKLGIVGLSAMVFSSVVGGGIYDISQNMACGAALGATIISWVVTAVGMLFLVMTFKILAKRRTDLKGGLYQYAREGFGNFIGFNVAWGFWLCTAFGNVAYAVMLNDSAAALFPTLHNHGIPTVIFGTVLIWLMYFICLKRNTHSFVRKYPYICCQTFLYLFYNRNFVYIFQDGPFHN